MADTMTEGACLDLEEIFGGPMVYIPDAGEPEEDRGWMAMAGEAMRFQSASSSASQ